MRVAGTFSLHSWAIRASALALLAALSACSSRDTVVAEQVMEAKQAADRAKASQIAAEQALLRIAKHQPPAVDAAVAETAVVEQDQSENEPGADVKPDVDPDAGLTDG
jgi:hypothetical protein